MNERMKREEKSREEKKEKNITRKKKTLTQYPKISHNKALVCQQQAGLAGNLSHYQVNVEDKGKSGK